MSMWSGLSNQSRERNRRGVLFGAVKAHLVLGLAGDVDIDGEQAAGFGIGGEGLVAQSLAGGGEIEGLQVRTAKARFGDVGDGQGDLVDDLPTKR